MSRVGSQPISIPDKIKVVIEGNSVTVEGPLGRLSRCLSPGIKCELDSEKKHMLVARASDAKPHRERHGLERSLINNMVIGVTQGYKKELEVVGIGYSVNLGGNVLEFQVGFTNTIKLEIPEGIKAEVLQATNPGRVAVSGCDKQQVGQFAARIRAVRPPEPYQGKGICYTGEVIRRKAGKAFVGTGA